MVLYPRRITVDTDSSEHVTPDSDVEMKEPEPDIDFGIDTIDFGADIDFGDEVIECGKNIIIYNNHIIFRTQGNIVSRLLDRFCPPSPVRLC